MDIDPFFIIIGNPENRRVGLFCSAAGIQGLPQPVVISWLDLLNDEAVWERLSQSAGYLRIESPGENFEVEKGLLAQGADLPDDEIDGLRLSPEAIGRLRFDKGLILHPRQWYLGFRRLLQRLGRLLVDNPRLKAVNPPEDIIRLFDKAGCHELCLTHGLPVPDAIENSGTFDALVDKMIPGPVKRVFIKPRHGSSASGVVAFETNGRAWQAVTSIEAVWSNGRLNLYNSLKIRRYSKLGEIREIIGALFREGVLVERWIPKLTWRNRACDLRVLTIAGKAAHTVVRMSRSPMTNLHLGNERGDLNDFILHIGPDCWAGIRDLAESTAVIFPQSLYLGLDILVSSRLKRLYICEINAFGDLLPNLIHDGLDPYAAQIQALRIMETRVA